MAYKRFHAAEQRRAFQFTEYRDLQTLAAEFNRKWGPIVPKLRHQKILPEWWDSQNEKGAASGND